MSNAARNRSAGAVHNAARGRVPVFIFAGLSPFTQEGELPGSRNEFIQWIQDVHDQRGIVREYMKYDNELRTGRNLKQIVHRALQFAHSDPKGPVYVVGAREVMEEAIAPAAVDPSFFAPLAPRAAPRRGGRGDRRRARERTPAARRHLLSRANAGRRSPSCSRLCRRLGIGVLESVPSAMNYPHDRSALPGQPLEPPVPERRARRGRRHPRHRQRRALDSDGQPAARRRADLPHRRRPAEGVDAALVHPRQGIASRPTRRRRFARCSLISTPTPPDEAAAEERRRHYAERHRRRAADARRPRERRRRHHHAGIPDRERAPADRRGRDRAQRGHHQLPGDRRSHARTRPGTMFASGGGSLGWNGGAAIGMKLAAPERDDRRADRRRLLHVLAALDRALDGAAVRHAVPAGRLQQPRLEGPEILGARRPSRRLRQPRRRYRHELRSAAGLCRHRRRRRRRIRPHGQAARPISRRRSPKRSAPCARRSARRCSTSGSPASDGASRSQAASASILSARSAHGRGAST